MSLLFKPTTIKWQTVGFIYVSIYGYHKEEYYCKLKRYKQYLMSDMI